MDYKAENRVCEVCGNAENRLIWEKKAWTKTAVIKQGTDVFHYKDVFCETCGLIYKNPMLTRESQEHFYAGPYAQLYKSAQMQGIPKRTIVEGVIRFVYVLDFLRSLEIDLKDKKVLEVGSGMGMLLRAVQSVGAEVKGIDMDARSCEIARKIFSLDIENVAFDDFKPVEKYDIILLCNTLEHFYSPRELLQKLRELLTDDGILLVEIPSYELPRTQLITDAFFSSAHNFTFSFQSFYSLATQCGYGLKEFAYAGHDSSMLFALRHGANRTFKLDSVSYNDTLALLKEHSSIHPVTQDIGKELFNTTNVSSIVERVFSELPHFSNQAFLAFVPTLLEAGRNQQVIDLMEQYKDGQNEDIESCYATSLHYKGLAYRQMGDFLRAKKCFLEAKENYPRFGDYNFIEELKIDGIISDESFAPYTWWNNLKILEDLG